jgi:retron-type reverse transcriptase
MPRRHDDLFGRIASFPALHAAARRAIRGKRRKPGAAAFMAGLEVELLQLERELTSGRYRTGRYLAFEVHDPKPRMVSAAPFRDRVVHHALYAVVGPLFERGFIHDTYANRVAKGTHRAVARYERFRDRYRYVLRCDIYRYFPAIDHAVLKQDLRRRIGCAATLWLLDTIIDGANPQEPVDTYYLGDDLFEPYRRRRGLPIGNLTSQFFANVYLDGLDHFCKEVLRAPGYVRYVDDFALFHDDPAVLEGWRALLAAWLAGRRLSLHPRKTLVAPTRHPARYLGFELLPDGRRRLPEDNLRRFRNRLRGLRDRWRAATIDRKTVDQRVTSWIAHAEHADTWRLRHAIFRGGWFAPAPGRPRKPGPSPAAGCCAGAPGTTIRRTSVPPTATGTTPATGTTMPASGLPVRPHAGAGASTDTPGVPRCVQGGS